MKNRNDRKTIRRREAEERQKFYDSMSALQKLNHISNRSGESKKETERLKKQLDKGL